jgi:hypothetical protein
MRPAPAPCAPPSRRAADSRRGAARQARAGCAGGPTDARVVRVSIRMGGRVLRHRRPAESAPRDARPGSARACEVPFPRESPGSAPSRRVLSAQPTAPTEPVAATTADHAAGRRARPTRRARRGPSRPHAPARRERRVCAGRGPRTALQDVAS